MYGRDCHEVTGGALEHLRSSIWLEGESPILDAKRPLVDQDVIPSEILDPNSSEVIRCQMSLYKDFIVKGAPTELLPTLWGNLATVTHHPSMTSNFRWNPARVFVSVAVLFFTELYILYLLFLFQCFFISLFHSLMGFVLSGIADSPGVSFEIVHQRSRSFLVMKCWCSDDTFMSFALSCYDRHSNFPNGELLALSNFFSCFHQLPPVICLINFPIYFKRTIDKFLNLPTKSILVPCFTFDDLKTCLRIPVSQHYGKADLFGLIEYLVIRLQTASSEHWVLSSTHLRIVS